jgi:hypothetical protein
MPKRCKMKNNKILIIYLILLILLNKNSLISQNAIFLNNNHITKGSKTQYIFDCFYGKKLKCFLDSIGRNFHRIDFLFPPDSKRKLFLSYDYDGENEINFYIEFDSLEYSDVNKEFFYVDINEFQKETISVIRYDIDTANKDKNSEWMENYLKTKQLYESSVYRLGDKEKYWSPKFKYGKKIHEFKYWQLKNSYFLEEYESKTIKELIDSIGNNFRGFYYYGLDNNLSGIDFRYDYKDSLEISVNIGIDEIENFDKSQLDFDKIKNYKIDMIYVFLLPISNRKNFISVKKD